MNGQAAGVKVRRLTVHRLIALALIPEYESDCECDSDSDSGA